MKRRKIIAIILVIFAVLLTSFTFYGYQILYSPNILVNKENRFIYITPDNSFDDIRDLLYEEGIVNEPVSFSFLSKLLDYDENVKAGRFKLESDMSNLEAIQLLRSGIQTPVNITFNNIRTRKELSERITSNIYIDPADFDKALDRFIGSNTEGFTGENIMAMFIPNTYEVYWTISAENLLERMHSEFERFWTQERRQKASQLGLTPIEVSILASIVQAESIKAEESRRIAGLYINRLDREIPLQADPTLVYAHGDFSIIRVLNKHKEIDSPYNTYKYTGLPPGPINMPEIRMIDAVLNYEQHDYIYMCAKEDFSGYHYFATNYRDHVRNARKYQRQLTIEQRKAKLEQTN